MDTLETPIAIRAYSQKPGKTPVGALPPTRNIEASPWTLVFDYPDRTAHVNEWVKLIKRRKKERLWPTLSIESFVKAGALRLGIEVLCPNCGKKNWYGIGPLDENLTCERCLQTFRFPQGSLDFKNTPWRYRVAGPFSVPDFANGAYSTVLALRFLAVGLGGASRHPITYSTNLNLKLDGKDVEIDFACWYAREWSSLLREEPAFVLGEAKSFASEAITEMDVKRLKLLASRLPGTVLVVAVMKNELSDSEKERVGKLALWGRKPMLGGGPRAPLVVLTGTELFADHHHVAHAWKQAGGQRKLLTKPAHVRMDNLVTLANLTQQVYLDLPDYWSWYDEHMRKRAGKET